VTKRDRAEVAALFREILLEQWATPCRRCRPPEKPAAQEAWLMCYGCRTRVYESRGWACRCDNDYCYIMFSKFTHLLKIGYSKDPEDRKIQVAHEMRDDTIEVLFATKGGKCLEQYLHHRFARYRWRREWFTCSDEIFSYAKEHMSRWSF
jgi:hypothetical protein